MFRKRYFFMPLASEKEVDRITKIAANHNLYCMYKIGIYGKETQDELYIRGSVWDYRRFLKELKEQPIS